MLALSLSSLPLEILHHIVRNLDSSHQRLNLALCSRTLHRLVLPLVLENITLRDPEAYELISLVHTLLRNPDLASSTRTLEFDNSPIDLNGSAWYYDHPGEFPSPEEGLDVDLNIIEPAVQQLFTADDEVPQKQLLAQLRAGNAYAWIALLLFSIPNVQELRFSEQFSFIFITNLIARAAARLPPFDSRPAFARLARVYMKRGDGEDELPSSALLSFFAFPSMRSVYGRMIIDQGDWDEVVSDSEEEEEPDRWKKQRAQIKIGDTAFSNKPTTSSVTEICLSMSTCCLAIPDLIEPCKYLKSFKYEHSSDYMQAAGFLPGKLADSLSLVKSSLEHLWLEYDGRSIGYDGPAKRDEPFGSLADYTSLKTLRIRIVNLIGHSLRNADGSLPADTKAFRQRLTHVLPRSLESLYIIDVHQGDFIDLALAVESLVDPGNFAVYTPCLRELTIKLSLIHSEGPSRMPVLLEGTLSLAQEVMEKCRLAGVQLNVTGASNAPSTE
ncbi:hypothetical protein FQN50_007774 [Emmonsiellopsis sp. PD_5]|nr:hypothetical protein FQN50_007774 [Emmonsiellopsis sp. PD_5]